MTTNLRKQKTITAIFWSVIAVMLLAMGIYAIRDLPMRLAMKVSPNIHLAIEMSTDNSVYKTVFKNYGNETLDSNINRTIEDGNKITLTGDIFDNIYSNEPLYIRITNYTQPSDVNDTINYSNGPALSAYFSAENCVTNYPSYGVQNIASYDGTNLHSKTFVVVPQSVIVNSSYEFNLKLELSNYQAKEFNVEQTLTGVTSFNNFDDTKAIVGQNFATTLLSDNNSNIVNVNQVTFGGTTLVEDVNYSFDNTTGELVVYGSVFTAGSPITNELVINASQKISNVQILVSNYSNTTARLKYNKNMHRPGANFYVETNYDFNAMTVNAGGGIFCLYLT